MNLLSWHGVTLVKQGSVILNKVSLGLKEGELVGLVGPNGAGKTALLRLAVGLDRPSAGEILLQGRPLGGMRSRERSRLLAYLPQQAEAAWPITARDAVGLGRTPHGDRQEKIIERCLAEVGMTAFADRTLTALSGGERALVLLARALAVEAGLLLLDEPTANLDPAHQLQVMEVLRRRAHQGDAVLVVLHDLAMAARCCDRLLVLHQGRLVAEGSGGEILDDPLLRRVFNITVARGEIGGQRIFLPDRWVA